MSTCRLAWSVVSVAAVIMAVNAAGYAEEPPVKGRGLRVFHVGNSHTDQAYGMHDIARARGYSSAMFKRDMIPGASLSWLWTYIKPDAIEEISTEKWDVLTLQTSTGSGTRVEGAVRFGAGYGKGSGYASLVYEGSPDCQVYLFDSYPIRGKGAADSAPEQKWTQAQKTKQGEIIPAPRDAAETAADAIAALYPQRKPCLIIPVGIVMCELDKLMKKGKVPDYTSAYEFLEDRSHLNNDGKYELALVMPGVPEVPSDKLEPAYVGVKYYAKIKTNGGYGVVTISAEKGSLPIGLRLDTETGEISGVPSAVWTKPVKVSLGDEKNRHSSKLLRLPVSKKPVHGAVCGIYYQSFNCVADHTKYLRDEVVISSNFTTDMIENQAEQPFALRFVSNIKIAEPGEYTFYIEAPNAAVLDINGKRIVDKDSFVSHKKVKPISGTLELDAGTHPIEVILYRRGLGVREYAKWSFSWSAPGSKSNPSRTTC